MLNRFKYYLPNVAQSWLLVLLMVVGGGLLVGTINILLILIFPSLSETITLLTYPIIFIPPFLIILHSSRKELRNRIFEECIPSVMEINNPNFGRLGAVLSMVFLFFLVFSINLITEPITYWMGVPDFLEKLMNQIHSNKISTFISIVLFAPVLEEFFCRGIILRGLLHHVTPIKAIVLSAFIFGVMHLNPWQAIPAFIIGLFMGWIYWRTHSLWATIFIHFVNNGFSYIITILFPNLPIDFGFVDLIPSNYYYIIYALSLTYTIVIILLMNKNYDKTIPIKIQPHT